MADGFQGPPSVNFYSMLSGLGDTIQKNQQQNAIASAFQPGPDDKVDYGQALGAVARYNPTLAVAMQSHIDAQAQQAAASAHQLAREKIEDDWADTTREDSLKAHADSVALQRATLDNAANRPFEVDVPGLFGTTTKTTVVRGPNGSYQQINLNPSAAPAAGAAPSGGGIFGGISKPVGWGDAPATAPQQASAAPPAPMPQPSAPMPVASPASFGDRFSAAAPQSVAPSTAPPAITMPAPQDSAPLDAIDPTSGRREAWLKTQSPAEAVVIQKVAEGKLDLKTLPSNMRYGVTQAVLHYMPGYDQASESMPQATVDFLADRTRLGDRSNLVGLSRTPGVIARIQNTAAQREAAGIPISDEAKSVVNNATTLGARRSAENKLGGITTNNEFYGNNALGAMDIAEKASASVPRTNYPDVNGAINAYNTKTGDPKTVALGAALNTVINDYAKFSGGGVGTDALRGEAMSMLNGKHSHEQVKSVLDMMRTEIKRGQQSPGMVRGTFNDVYAPGGSGAPPKANTAPQAPASDAKPNVTSTGIKWSVQ